MGSHSAHIGQDAVVHYPWHPLYGRRVRRIISERRASGEIVHVEPTPGIVTVRGMTPTQRQLTLNALAHLLIEASGSAIGEASHEHA